MNLNSIHTIYFIGIGGIGMSALARYFNMQGKTVSGYDKTPSENIEELIKMGIAVNFNDSVSEVENAFDVKTTLVVFTPAVPKSSAQLNYFKEQGFTILKRAELLGELSKNKYCIAIAGTHGKTTSTSILGHILAECGVKVTAFLGGISENYNSNLIMKGDDVIVVEADEFDRSFLQLSPDMAAITSVDADHLDIYNNEVEFLNSFKAFANRLPKDGRLFIKEGLPFSGVTFGFNVKSSYAVSDITIKNGTHYFSIHTPTKTFKEVAFNLPGEHNILNALVAFAMALEYGCKASAILKALKTYKGVKRRFSYQVKTDAFSFIDDYAHHPEEINAIYKAVKTIYPNRRNLVIFQPHLFSRTRDFMTEFAKSLSKFDEVILLDIYPAREKPIKGVTSESLLKLITQTKKQFITKAKLHQAVQLSKPEVLLTLGAGDIGNEVKPLKKALGYEA